MVMTAAKSLLLMVLLLDCVAVSANPTHPPRQQQESQCVVLLHGLARTTASMKKFQVELERGGYKVINVGYPSRKKPIQELASPAVLEGLDGCNKHGRETVHFVTQSLGGILIRYFLSRKTIPGLGRVVMLAPPNKGSQAADALSKLPGFNFIFGPAGTQLKTGDNGILATLGAANFEAGIIAGNRSVNPLFSSHLPKPNDGTISVESAKLEDMRDFLVVPHSHPFIMRSDEVIDQAIHFLNYGRFKRNEVSPSQ
jgi:hypothetical protein